MSDLVLCCTCKVEKPPTAFSYNKDRASYFVRCKACSNEAAIQTRNAKTQQALIMLGYRCARCGYDEAPRAFQIDHVNGGGRAEFRRIGYYKIVARVLRGEPGYQLLCANCNVIKRFANGEGCRVRAFPQDIEIDFS